VLRNECRVLNVDRRTLARNIPHHATHHGTARRNIGELLDLDSRMLSLLVHPFGPGFRKLRKMTNVTAKRWINRARAPQRPGAKPE